MKLSVFAVKNVDAISKIISSLITSAVSINRVS